MSIKFVRIDDRLIHGQVMTTWIKKYDIEQVIIVNDEISNNSTRQKILKLSAPSNLKLHVFAVDKFIQIIKNNSVNRNTMLIFTGPFDVERILGEGIEISYLNVGNISKTEDRTKISSGVAVNETELESFKNIIDMGVNVEIQMVPNDKITKMNKFI